MTKKQGHLTKRFFESKLNSILRVRTGCINRNDPSEVHTEPSWTESRWFETSVLLRYSINQFFRSKTIFYFGAKNIFDLSGWAKSVNIILFSWVYLYLPTGKQNTMISLLLSFPNLWEKYASYDPIFCSSMLGCFWRKNLFRKISYITMNFEDAEEADS